ncbi:DMP19 family protein [Paenibacillus glycanilyticus]|uniref:DMP19 family protein n=1 Tax=Paenibacillus glycanilyticus TaxID=126569 RepID=UPI003EB9DCA0
MSNLHAIVQQLIPEKEHLHTTSASELIEQVCSNRYKQESYYTNDKEVFKKLPEVLQDIILLIDLDTELTMNGLLGFAENSSGRYLDETIKVLERIGAVNDANALQELKDILKEYGASTHILNDDIQLVQQYEVQSFAQTHQIFDEEFYDRIQKAEEKLYVYANQGNVFDHLTAYIEANKKELMDNIVVYL